jgi:hypothetical protein
MNDSASLVMTFFVAVDVDPTVMNYDQDEQKQTRHC